MSTIISSTGTKTGADAVYRTSAVHGEDTITLVWYSLSKEDTDSVCEKGFIELAKERGEFYFLHRNCYATVGILAINSTYFDYKYDKTVFLYTDKRIPIDHWMESIGIVGTVAFLFKRHFYLMNY